MFEKEIHIYVINTKIEAEFMKPFSWILEKKKILFVQTSSKLITPPNASQTICWITLVRYFVENLTFIYDLTIAI